MAVFEYPGVYVIEEDMSTRPVQGVSTSTLLMIGITRRGVANKPQLVTSWPDFIDKYAYGLDSPFRNDAYLPYCLYGYFNNKGTRSYIYRVVGPTAKKAVYSFVDTDTEPKPVVIVSALDEGEWGNKIGVKLATNTDGGYDFTVKYADNVVATYIGVSLSENDEKFIEKVVNGVDKYVFVEVAQSGMTPATGELDSDKPLTGGTDDTTNITDTDYEDALNACKILEDANIVAIPESQSEIVCTAGLAFTEGKEDNVFLCDGEESATISQIKTFKEGLVSDYGALYYPWILVSDPVAVGTDKTKWIPTCGHVAGMIARTDANRSVYKAPAGLECQLFGALKLKTDITDEEQAVLNPIGINVIRSFKNGGIVPWGARTMNNKYLNIRRGLNYLKASLKANTRWAVFEPNNSKLWRKLSVSTKAFLLTEYGKGGFKGDEPAQAFFVKCDEQVNRPETVKLGQVWIIVGVAIAEPGEFVILKIGQYDGGTTIEEM